MQAFRVQFPNSALAWSHALPASSVALAAVSSKSSPTDTISLIYAETSLQEIRAISAVDVPANGGNGAEKQRRSVKLRRAVAVDSLQQNKV